MRWLLMLALLAIAARPAEAQENEGETLFRNFAHKLREVKTLQVRFEIGITDSDDNKGHLKGRLILGEGDKVWAEGEGKPYDDEMVKFTLISDGVNMRTTGKTPKQDKIDKSKGIGAYFRESLSREGVFGCLLNMERRNRPEPRVAKMTDFKLAKEKIGQRNTQVVQWTLRENNVKGVSLKLWLDAQTQLPIKLTMTGGGAGVFAFTETYTEFILDAKLDAKWFTLPK